MQAAIAVATERNGAKAVVNSKIKDEDLPSLDEIRINPNLDKTKGLEEKDLQEALRNAKGLDIEDDKTMVDFGVEEQRAATRMAEKTVEYSRKSDFDTIKAATQEMNEKMRELNMGDLSPSFIDRFLPKAAAKRIQNVLQQHQDISETVKRSLQALAEEKKKLITYRAAAEQDINESLELIRRFDVKISELELGRDAFKKRVDKFVDENKDKTDEKTTQKLKHFEMVKGLLERKVTDLEAARTDQFTTIENLRNLQGTYNVLILSAEDQANYCRQAWNNTVSILTHAARQKGVQEAIDSQRETAGMWLKARGDATVKTVENTMRVLQTSVVDLERVKESIDKAEEANLKLIEGCKVAQTKLFDMAKEMTARSKLASEHTAQAAKASTEEIAGMINELASSSMPSRN